MDCLPAERSELLELHRQREVAFDRHAAGEIGGSGVLLATRDPEEEVLTDPDHARGAVAALACGDPAVVDLQQPAADAFDVEAVGRVLTARARGIDVLSEPLEQLARRRRRFRRRSHAAPGWPGGGR